MDAGSFGVPRRFEILESIPAIAVPVSLSVAVGGVLVGVLQWLVLRRYLAQAGRWVLASLGATAVFALVVFSLGAFSPDAGLVGGAVLYGTVVGVLQWLVLRRQATRAGWWVPTSTVGWLVGIPLGGMLGPPGWAWYGAITGAALVWLLRRRPLGSEQRPARALTPR
jgi:hypothetical protein